MRDWLARYGRLPSSYDWSRTHARRRGGQALERLATGDWPAASVVTGLFGTWAAARTAALQALAEWAAQGVATQRGFQVPTPYLKVRVPAAPHPDPVRRSATGSRPRAATISP